MPKYLLTYLLTLLMAGGMAAAAPQSAPATQTAPSTQPATVMTQPAAAATNPAVPITQAAAPMTQPASLAHILPADTRLYLELRDLDAVLASPVGAALTALVRVPRQQLPATAPGTSSVPASSPSNLSAARPTPASWRARMGETLGIPSASAAQILLSGRLVFAADGWSQLGDAVLVASPLHPAALESELAAHRVPATSGRKVRIHRLDNHHQLACDGRFAVVGRAVEPNGLFNRTVALWSRESGVSLGNIIEFRDRTAAIPAGAQVLFYANANRRAAASQPTGIADVLGRVFEAWAAGLTLTPGGATLDASGRLIAPQPPPPQTQPASLSTELLARVPQSTLLAWSQRTDFAIEYQRLKSPDAAPLRFYLDVLQAGLQPGALERDVLPHLVGESLFVIGHLPVSPPAPAAASTTAPASRPSTVLLLPTACMMVRTDAPDVVENTLLHISNNLLKLVNLQKLPGGPVTRKDLASEPNSVLHVIDIGRLFDGRTDCEFLRTLELSWTVADGWLVIGLHGDWVRQMLRTRRGGPDSMPAEPAAVADRQARQSGRNALILLVAQPRAAGDMIFSWIDYVGVHHPELLRAQWWKDLRHRPTASGMQLGILSKPTTQPAVAVAQTVPGWPAHERLKPGDLVIAVDGQALDPAAPEASLRQLVASRPAGAAIAFRVLRDGVEVPVSVPLPAPPDPAAPGLQPVELLRRVADLLRLFPSASYSLWAQAPDVLQARLELRFTPSR